MKNSKKGFTMVELSLSIAFLSILSITIVLIITNAVSAYHRGLTLNDVNSVGMDLVNDMRGTIQNSPGTSATSLCATAYTGNDGAKGACLDDHASKFTSIVHHERIKIGNDNDYNEAPIYGAFCTGRYSYIWNSGYAFWTSGVQFEKSNVAPRASLNLQGAPKDFKLLKVRDESRSICVNAVKDASRNGYEKNAEVNNNYSFSLTSSEDNDPPVDLLAAKRNLAIYDLTVPVPADNSHGALFYSVSFILGTMQGGINVMAAGDYCATPGGYNSSLENLDYCAINKFNFTAQATGGGK